MGDRIDALGMVHSCEQTPSESKPLVRGVLVKHDGCTYDAVITDGKAWFCNKCGTAGRFCDECGQPVNGLELWQQVVEGGAGLAFGHRECIEREWGPAT